MQTRIAASPLLFAEDVELCVNEKSMQHRVASRPSRLIASSCVLLVYAVASRLEYIRTDVARGCDQCIPARATGRGGDIV